MGNVSRHRGGVFIGRTATPFMRSVMRDKRILRIFPAVIKSGAEHRTRGRPRLRSATSLRNRVPKCNLGTRISSPERKVFNPIGEIRWIAALRNEMQVAHTLADRNAELVGVDDATEWGGPTLSPGGFCKRVFVAGEDNASNLFGTLH